MREDYSRDQKNKCSINQRIWTEWEYCSNTDSNTQEKQY